MTDTINALFVYWILLLLLWVAVLVGLRQRLHQPVFIVLFSLTITAHLGFMWARDMWGSAKNQAPRLPSRKRIEVNSTLDLISAYQLAPTEVVLGLAPGKRPVKIDVMDRHMLLGGLTGGGKTFEIHAMLIQLFGKGRRFTDQVDVYILDMKNHPKDMLREWAVLCKGYAARGHDGSITEALDLLRHIDTMLQVETTKKILLIVEEAPVLSSDQEGDKLLERIASQLRLNGAVIMTVQHAHYAALKTLTKHNLERRLAGLVMNVTQAETLLEVRPDKKQLPKKRGQYLLHEPGNTSIISLTAPKPDLPEEIRLVVQANQLFAAEADERLKIFYDMLSNLQPGAAAPGVKGLAKQYTWLKNAQFRLLVAQRNFAEAGALIKPAKRGERYKLAQHFPVAFKMVSDYIAAGRWQEEPESVIKDEEE